MNNLLVYANHSMHINTMSIFNVHVHVCMLNNYFLLVDKIGIFQPIVATRSTRSKGILNIKQMFLIMPIIHVFRERRSYSVYCYWCI